MADILIFGDSNTHGTVPLRVLGAFARHAPGTRWPDVMAARLGPGHRVIADGLPGRTTVHDDVVDGGARNGAAVLPAVLGSHVPLDLVVLMLGTNDLKPRFATSAFDIAKSTERLVGMVRAQVPGAGVMVVAPVPVREAGVLAAAFAGAEARQAGPGGSLDAHLEAMCARTGAAFLRAGDHVTVSAVDGVHWEAEAHAAFGAAMAAAVARLLPQEGTRQGPQEGPRQGETVATAAAMAVAKPAGGLAAPDPGADAAPVTLDRAVPPDWVDYNGHMNEAHYLTVFSDATDQLLDWAGMDAACVAAGYSVFTVETHIRHLGEVDIGDRIAVTTQVIAGGGRKLHLWHELRVGGALCATGEQLLLHMDLGSRRSAPPREDVAAWLGTMREAHAALPRPEGLGRSVGEPVRAP